VRYKKMPNEHFEFTTEILGYSTIEDTILSHYDLGYANSSSIMELPEGHSSSHYISATKGIIEFSARVGKMKDEKYLVTCYPSSVKRKI
jgi:hypothetical protein